MKPHRVELRLNQDLKDKLDFLTNHFSAKNRCDVIYRLIGDEYIKITNSQKLFDCTPAWLCKGKDVIG